MSKELIKETRDYESFDCHSDAGTGLKIECPNCREEVRFATYQWWASECSCGQWDLKAVLDATNKG